MTTTRVDHIRDFRRTVIAANKEATKKEVFKDLLNRLFANDDETRDVVDAITAGAEMTVLNIPRKGEMRRGSADTLYYKVIIEFENDLKRTLPHAKQQLAGYLLGQVRSGEGYNFTLIASDFINWKVFSPDVSQLDSLETLSEEDLNLKEVESASFTLDEDKSEAFYYWIDRFLFKEEKQKPTLKRIEERFGYQSPIFIQCFREMRKNFRSVKDSGEVKVSFEQWDKFLSIAYGSYIPSEQNFLIHTYLSIFAKMLAYAVVSNDEYIDDEEMHEIVDGSIFQKFNISNFVENDFFHWIAGEQSFPVLKKSFRLIGQELSTFDFLDVDEDILKGVYQEMTDLDTRHALGEYYTPDWLCERMVCEFDFKRTDKILDPACGSGSFLRAIIARLKRLHPQLSSEELNAQVTGIDIHPLSVQIAKTTLLLALGRDVVKAKSPVHLNVILANALRTPQGVEDMFGNQFRMQIDKQGYSLDIRIFEDMRLFDLALELCEELADQTTHQNDIELGAFRKILKKQSESVGVPEEVARSFHQIYRGFKQVKESGRDSIWNFIVQNLYRPYFLEQKFDYVIGNPPWLTYSDVKNADYQDVLNALAVQYEVKPERTANFPHLEIAAIFLAYCSSYFLQAGGKIAFVLPRSFFSADHHDNTRSGKARGFHLIAAWDLDAVVPLFRIPSCVLFGLKSESHKDFPPSGLPGKLFSGRLSTHNSNLSEASPRLHETDVSWFYVKRNKTSALSQRQTAARHEANPYRDKFKQGATIVPRSVYFVDLYQDKPPDFEGRVLNIRTSIAARTDAKPPWTGIDLKGRVESNFLFRTALSKSIVPFGFFDPSLVVLPVTIELTAAGDKKLYLNSSRELREKGFLHASRWFAHGERIWNEHKTEKAASMTNLGRLDFQRGLSEQNLNYPYLVLFTKSAKDANCAVCKREDLDLEFIADYVTYVFYTRHLGEAYYLAGVLNSQTTNALIKDFQTRGLFGARDVTKKILDVYFPRFNGRDEVHSQIADLSQRAHIAAAELLQIHRVEGALTPHRLGRLRLDIKKELKDEMQQIDLLAEKIIK